MKLSKDATFDALRTTTIENIDRSQRRMQNANLAGLEHISMVKIYVAGRSLILKNSPYWRLEHHQALGDQTGAASSSGRPDATREPLNAGEMQVYPQTNTDGEPYIRKFDDKAKAVSLRMRNKNSAVVLHSMCAKFGRDTVSVQNSDLEPVNEGLLMVFMLANQ